MLLPCWTLRCLLRYGSIANNHQYEALHYSMKSTPSRTCDNRRAVPSLPPGMPHTMPKADTGRLPDESATLHLNLKRAGTSRRTKYYTGACTTGNAHNAHPEEPRPTMLPELFPTGTEFANVQGVPVSCTRNGICREWDRDANRHFPIESFIYQGTIVTEAVFRELHRKRNGVCWRSDSLGKYQ